MEKRFRQCVCLNLHYTTPTKLTTHYCIKRQICILYVLRLFDYATWGIWNKWHSKAIQHIIFISKRWWLSAKESSAIWLEGYGTYTSDGAYDDQRAAEALHKQPEDTSTHGNEWNCHNAFVRDGEDIMNHKIPRLC